MLILFYRLYESAVSEKDTVAAYKEDDEVETGEHAEARYPSVGSDSVVHHGIPVLAG